MAALLQVPPGRPGLEDPQERARTWPLARNILRGTGHAVKHRTRKGRKIAVDAVLERREREAMLRRIGQALAAPQAIEDARREGIAGPDPVDHRRDEGGIARAPLVAGKIGRAHV